MGQGASEGFLTLGLLLRQMAGRNGGRYNNKYIVFSVLPNTFPFLYILFPRREFSASPGIHQFTARTVALFRPSRAIPHFNSAAGLLYGENAIQYESADVIRIL